MFPAGEFKLVFVKDVLFDDDLNNNKYKVI